MLDDYRVVVETAVRWGDMDSLGHVNNIMYLQYFESARIVYIERMGLGPPGPHWLESGLIIGAVSCTFKAPVTYPDTLSVGARVTAVGQDRLIMEHAAWSHKLGKVAAEGDALLVAYDYTRGRRTSLPAEWRAAITTLEGSQPAVLAPRARRVRAHE